jgi:hypothetical protein
MAKKKTVRYVANHKLPKTWNRLLDLGDFFRLARVAEAEGNPPGMSSDQYENFREIGRIDRVELGIAAFSLLCIIITFIWLR